MSPYSLAFTETWWAGQPSDLRGTMSHVMTDQPTEMPASGPDPAVADQSTESAELTIAESVATAVTGTILGGAAVWFLAPICFVC